MHAISVKLLIKSVGHMDLMQIMLSCVTKQRLSFLDVQELCFALTYWCPVILNCTAMCSDLFARSVCEGEIYLLMC